MALGAGTAQGFGPNGIPADVSADPVSEPQGSGNFADTDGSVATGSEPGTEGGTTAAAGVNGSRARLPYNLDPATHAGDGQLAVGAAAARRSCARPGTGCPTAGRRPARCWWSPPPDGSTPARCVVQWATDEQAASGQPGGSVGFADVGAVPRGATCAPR